MFTQLKATSESSIVRARLSGSQVVENRSTEGIPSQRTRQRIEDENEEEDD